MQVPPVSSSKKPPFQVVFYFVILNQFSWRTIPGEQLSEIEIEWIRTHTPFGTQPIQGFHILF